MKAALHDQAIDEIFRGLDQSGLPGAAVGIAIGGNPVYRKGFGLASMELPLTLTPQTRMRIYSITKHFTCLAYLLLCEEGKAGLDDPVGKYLPQLHPVTHRVTMRQLMSNTSGLRDACDIRWFFSGIEGTVSGSELLALYRNIDDVNFAPGQAWCYNNGAYHILGAVIETLADQPLAEVFRRRIFEPIGMHDTLLRRVDTDFIPNSASMHMLGPENKFEKRYLPGELAGEGGIVSTVDDMLRWMRNIANPVVGSQETWSLMTTAQKLADGAETGYGLGLFLRRYRGTALVSHSGGGLGSNAQMIRAPGLDIDIIVLANRSDVSSVELAARVLDVCLGMNTEPERRDRVSLTGLFRSRKTGRVAHLYAREKGQVVAFDGGDEIPVLLTADHELSPLTHSGSSFAIKWSGDTTNPNYICHESFGTDDELTAVPNAPSVSIETIAGQYWAGGIQVQFAVAQGPEGGQMLTMGKFGGRAYRLERLAARVWRVISKDDAVWSGTMIVESEEGTLVLSTPSTWQVPLRRQRDAKT